MKSKKFNIFSSCRCGRLNKKIFLLLLVAVTLFVNGFLFLRASAYESLSESYTISGGVDNTEEENVLFSDQDINTLSLSDEKRIRNNSPSWTKGDNYNENIYLEFNFSPNISPEAIIESVIINNKFRRDGALDGVKLEVWDGEKFVDFNITKGTINIDHTDMIDITSVINTVDKLNNLKIRFLAYRSIGDPNTKTSHDFIGVDVVYHLPDEIPIEPAFHTDIEEDILEDTIWAKDKSPYVIKDSIAVSDGATLTIEKGVVVKFYNQAGLAILGKLNILGDSLDRVYFTSLNDDSLGGDSEGDGDYAPEIGDFGGISFYESDDISNINNLSVNYADNSFSILSSKINLSNVNISSSTGSFFVEKGVADIDNILIEDGYLHINNSDIKISNSNINSKNSGSIVYGSSKIDLINTSIISSSISDSVFSLYKKSSAKVSGCTFSNAGYGIYVYDESSLDIVNSKISGGEYGIFVFDESNLVMNSSIISDQSVVGIQSFYNEDFYSENNIKISKSEIINNNYGFILDDSLFDIKNNSISNNRFGAVTHSGNLINLNNNFWGDQTGPYNFISNKEGKGNEVNDWISFVPFLKTDPTKNTKNPVIIIPGITGSYLIKDYDDKEEIWPNVLKLLSPLSINDEFLNDLILKEDGTQKLEFPIVLGDIIRKIANVHVFDILIDKLKEDGYIEDENLFVFPYDWRLSSSYTASLLDKKIKEIKEKTGQEKVDIIAHSMGGIVSKKYIVDFGGDSIDQLIFLGTPQLGAPKAFKVLTYGDHMGFWKLFLGLSNSRAKIISQNMPSVYELLPSIKYISKNGSYVSKNEGSLSSVLSYNQTRDLMIENGRNSLMYPIAESLHDSIDDLDLSSIKSYNFIGCKEPTIGKITIGQESSWFKNILKKKVDYEIGYVDGDGTVPLISAREAISSERFYVEGTSHASLPADNNVINMITTILKNDIVNFNNNLHDSDESCGIEGDVLSSHSPVLIHVYDENNNHTGPDGNGDIEYGIEGVEYDVVEDVNYVFLPKGKNYKIVTEATDTGGFTLKIEEQKNEEIINIHKWTLVPQPSLNTKGELMIGPDYNTSVYELKIDEDGDGVFDNELIEGFDGTSVAESKTKIKERVIGNIVKNNQEKEIIETKILNQNNDIFETSPVDNNDNLKIDEIVNENLIPRNDENYDDKKNVLLANVGNVKQDNYKLFLIISVVLVSWLAIRLIFKLK